MAAPATATDPDTGSSPDGTQVLFTADPAGSGDLYLADVPAFDSLPESPVS